MSALPPGAQARLAATDPALPPAARLAEAARSRGDAQETLALTRAAIAAAPQDHALRISMAVLQARIGAHGSAVTSALPVLAAAQADRALADRIGMLGDTLARNGAVAEACTLLRAVWRASPRPVMARALLAAGLPSYRRSLNEGADAALLAEMAAAALPGIAILPEAALVELARLAEDAGRGDLVRALGLSALAAGAADRAAQIGGFAGAAPLTAGLALLASGRAARAGIAFEAALAAAPQDPAALFNAAYAALAAGDALRAETLFAALPACGAQAMADAAWPCFGELPWPFAAPPVAPPGRGDWPRIRLVTPCFNPGPWLEETILSVAAQGYPAVEHVVVDACSTDGTAEVLARHRHRLHAVIVEPDSGPAEAICKGFAFKGLAGSDADLLGWLNADDMLAPGALHRLGAAFAADPAADIVHGTCIAHRARRIATVHRPLPGGPGQFMPEGLMDIFGALARGEFFLTPEMLFTRRLWERLGGTLDRSLGACFDYEFWLRAAEAGARPVGTAWPTAFFRLHAGQISGGRARVAREQVAIRDRRAPGRGAAAGARLRAALDPARRPARLVLVDPRAVETMSAAAREEARAALSREGFLLDIRANLDEVAPEAILVRMLRAHDGPEWAVGLRARGFTGPIIGWLTEDDRDPDANAAMLGVLDAVVPSRAACRAALLQGAVPVLPALLPPHGGIAAAEAAAALGAGDGGEEPVADHAALVSALIRGRQPVPAPGAAGVEGLLAGAGIAGLPAGAAGAAARHRAGLSLLLAPRLVALVAALREATAP